MSDNPSPETSRRLASLRTHHARLEAQVDHEYRQRVPDNERLKRLKRRKLTLRDEIVRLGGQ
jgi:hypothetical protein